MILTGYDILRGVGVGVASRLALLYRGARTAVPHVLGFERA